MLPLVQLYMYKLIIDSVTLGIPSPDVLASIGQVLFFIGIAGIAYLANSVTGIIDGVLRQKYSLYLTDYIYSLIHTKSVRIDLAYVEDSKYRDILHRAQREASYRPSRILNNISSILQNGISIIGIAGLLFSLHWAIVIVLLAATIPEIIVRMKYSGKFYSWERKSTKSERRALYFNWMLTLYAFAKEIRLFELGEYFIAQFRKARNRLREERHDLAKKRAFRETFTQIFGALAVFGSYGFIAYRTLSGTLTIGDMVMYFQAFQRGHGFLQKILGNIAEVHENNLFLLDLFEFLDLKPKVHEPVSPKQFPRPIKNGISYNNVSFQYSSDGEKVLDEISFSLGAGEVIAFAGENGSGKTTLIKLLCRLYDPTEGTITIDGTDLRDFRISDLLDEISVIFQDYVNYQLSARENIWFGQSKNPPDDERLKRAAQEAGTDDFISRLRFGYETVLGSWFDDSRELSTGEWQKVALARMLYSDAQIIVLDEPINSIDLKSSYEMMQNLHYLLKDRTGIVISHRLEIIRQTDCIYYLKKGRIIEKGSHEELIEMNGEYAKIFRLQAAYYK
ncbi:MAG: ABC transporter ATP-binding protein [candidate division Zixibacteria bacterium]|nr:ABC transporter ATP-binding protein [Candidatus Tariuqbacter arcticus]